MTSRFSLLMWIAYPAIAALLIGCGNKKNPYWCPGLPDDNCTEDGWVRRCNNSSDCVAPEAAVCDTQSMSCVQCTMAESSACSGTTPICGMDDKCRGCSEHSECAASNVCLPTGSCATANQ